MTTSAIAALSDFIKDEMGYEGDIDPNADLLEEKILDSFNVVEVASFIQEHFEVALDGGDLVRDNFSTLAAMISLIDRRKTAS